MGLDLGRWVRDRANQVRDVFDANTEDDKKRRLAEQRKNFKGVPYAYPTMNSPTVQSYKAQQQSRGVARPQQNIGQAVLGNTARFGNTVRAGAGGVYGLGKIGAASMFGSDKDYLDTIRGVETTLGKDLSPESGFFNAGTFFDDAEQAANISAADLAKKTVGGGLGVASEVLPVGRGATAAKFAPVKGASYLDNAARLAKGDLALGVAGSSGQQLVETGTIDPVEALISGGASVALGQAPLAIGTGGRQVFNDVRAMDARGGVEIKPKVKAKPKKVDGIELPDDIDPNDPFGNDKFLKRLRNEMGRTFVDDDAEMITFLRKVEKETGREGLVDRWYFDTGNVRASNSIANAKLKNSAEVDAAFKGLSKKDLKKFDDYTAARAELKNYKGKQTSLPRAELKKIVSEADPEFDARYKQLNKFWNKKADELFKAGIISNKKRQFYKSQKDYVRIQRKIEEDVLVGKFGTSQSRNLRSTSTKQRRTGSRRKVLPPSETLLKRSQQLELEIQRNKAGQQTINLLKELGLAKPVSKAKGKNTIAVFSNGTKKEFEVPMDIKRVVDNVKPYQLGIIAQVVSAPARALRAGATGLSLPFATTNYMRDQISSAVFSDNVLRTHHPYNIAQGIGSATRDFYGESTHPLWKKFEEAMGDQTIFDELRNAKNAKRQLREIREGGKGKLKNAIDSPASMVRTLEDFISITEKATRFQNFKGVYEKAIKDGLDPADAYMKATNAARQNSVDFQRNSSFTRAANLIFPYFNSGIQGSRNVARSFRDRPVSTSMKSVGFIALPTLGLTLHNYSDPLRKEAYDSLHDYEKEDNFIFIHNPEQRADGSWTGIIKIPKPQGYRELTDPVRQMTEAFLDNEPIEDIKGMFQQMASAFTGTTDVESLGGFAGSVIPQAAKPAVQAVANRDFYTGRQRVPQEMLESTDADGNPIDPGKMAFDNTSGTARIIGEKLGISPILVEKFVSDSFGSVGRVGTNAADNIGALAKGDKLFTKENESDFAIGGRSPINDFKRRTTEASGELLERNKSEGRKYFERIDKFKEEVKLTPQAEEAWSTLHPYKKNFLGEQILDIDSTYNPAKRLSTYNEHPKVFELDKKLDQAQRDEGKPGNPLFDLEKWQWRKVLEKEALPPGAKDPELSDLYKQDWYAEYRTGRDEFFKGIKENNTKELQEAIESGDTEKAERLQKTVDKFNNPENPYPEAAPNVQEAMDYYNTLPKGTGARSSWIKGNPGLWSEMTGHWAAIDNWQNIARGKRGLDATEGDVGEAAGYGDGDGSFSGYGGGYGGNRGRGSKKEKILDPRQYALSRTAGGSVSLPKVTSSGKVTTAKPIASKGGSRPKVTLKKSKV